MEWEPRENLNKSLMRLHDAEAHAVAGSAVELEIVPCSNTSTYSSFLEEASTAFSRNGSKKKWWAVLIEAKLLFFSSPHDTRCKQTLEIKGAAIKMHKSGVIEVNGKTDSVLVTHAEAASRKKWFDMLKVRPTARDGHANERATRTNRRDANERATRTKSATRTHRERARANARARVRITTTMCELIARAGGRRARRRAATERTEPRTPRRVDRRRPPSPRVGLTREANSRPGKPGALTGKSLASASLSAVTEGPSGADEGADDGSQHELESAVVNLLK